MSEYLDINNTPFRVLQIAPTIVNEDERTANEEEILDQLYNIFNQSKAI